MHPARHWHQRLTGRAMLVLAFVVTALTAVLARPQRSDSMEIGEGIIRKASPRSVPETLDRLEAILKT